MRYAYNSAEEGRVTVISRYEILRSHCHTPSHHTAKYKIMKRKYESESDDDDLKRDKSDDDEEEKSGKSRKRVATESEGKRGRV